ncbi:MAG TPA: hypothetical protein VFG59_10755 [Anaeromyxobacter sp.]|nr:hypothetical protein [Anaeromyxobacter sp.]
MSPSRVLYASLVLAAPFLGCQDYGFNPVASCLIQPGATQIKLSSESTADILFVVDDSPSTDPKQAGLAASFADFITRIVETNTDRVAHGLDPLDFHIAVTTSSIFLANSAGTYCQATSGNNQCCAVSSCADVASCTPGTSDGCNAGQLCITADLVGANASKIGEQSRCCAPSACAAASPGCTAGDLCAAMVTNYPSSFSGCTQGLATADAPYPAGAFVAAPGNPKVLDFAKTLGWATWGTANVDPDLNQLVEEFKENIQVGSCGSGEEQHLEAGKLAMGLALAGAQPGVAAGSWPHPGSKLVVVWVGDEDDCSSPPERPLVLAESEPGADSCVFDKDRPAAEQREYPVSRYGDYFPGLVHEGGAADLGAAFIVSGVPCQDGTFAPADSCSGTSVCPVNPPATCIPTQPVCGGAYAAGVRFHAFADELRSHDVQVVEGSVCDAFPPLTFGPTLAEIADLAAPPSSLRLESQPAATDVTVLRIIAPDGSTRKVCTPGADWCFVSCTDSSVEPACLASGATSQCIAINHTSGGCEANPGETYSAEYLGMVPAGGCASVADCNAALGTSTAWACFTAPGQTRGTCICGG